MDERYGYFVFVDGSFIDYYENPHLALNRKRIEASKTSRNVWVEKRVIIVE